MNVVHVPSMTPHPLFSRTNTPRTPKVHFKLPTKKGVPTVSLTNANAARTTDASDNLNSTPFAPNAALQSSIPFPSSPIPCPTPRKRAASEEHHGPTDMAFSEIELDSEDMNAKANAATPSARHISRTDIVRRRNKSCLAASFFHHDSYLARKAPPTLPTPSDKHATQSSEQAVKRSVARRDSMSAGTPSSKNIRKARRLLADAHFLASVHVSIASHIHARPKTYDAGSRDPDYAAQDTMLVERIWHTLIDMGYKPVPLAKDPSSPAATDACDPAREAAERAARRTTASTSTPISADRVQEVALEPTGVLSMPQLVAILTMRHRDRTTTRPRSASKKRLATPPSPSPLSMTVSSTAADLSVLPSSG
ncbi:hypothetical protein BN946_scf184640.g2 [Trametes cinnabarina]|uniref:Uncharacterized protein n=1 Tax=Pycnoporus cinnabarinus TaxID=5643 RepID=A0A060SKI4_PYCCI|nr:hypothetical protein BN946_scf184640.g2 [Trametes cinnabarina]